MQKGKAVNNIHIQVYVVMWNKTWSQSPQLTSHFCSMIVVLITPPGSFWAILFFPFNSEETVSEKRTLSGVHASSPDLASHVLK